MIWRKCGRSSISNQKMHTTWMKAGLQLVRKSQGGVLSTLKSVNNSKQSLGVRSGLRWWNIFALMEALFLLSSFLKRKNCQDDGFRRIFMVDGGSTATQKDGQAMIMVWIGLVRCFDPETRDKVAGEYRLLICDGHDSHITAEFIAHCMDNKILLMILPPHSSHLTQPLDVGVFGALKKHMATELYPLMRTGVARIQKVEWLSAFVGAHDKALSVRNIHGGFRGTGIHPFDPTKVLCRVTSSTSPQPQTRPSTPSNQLTPFNDAVLTDSPADFNAVATTCQ